MITDSKSLLAKLLASENITVEHRKSPTAYFDTKNRVMVLPAWKAMTSSLYDLLLGHEVGHALYTPPQGWHDAVTDTTKKGFKSYLNVIEDTRIEKMIQEKFPGLKTSFRKGYKDLMDKDFFGVHSGNYVIQDLPLIDRINLHYKIGSYLNIKFSDKEQPYIEKIENIKTWDDVVAIAEELYQYAKEEMQLRDFDDLESEWDEDTYSDDDGGEFDDDDLSDTGGDSAGPKEQDPSSKTDEYFRRRENEFIDDKVKPYVYLYKPTPNLEQIIVPYKKIKPFYNKFSRGLDTVDDYLKDFDALVNEAKNNLFNRFNTNNKTYISYLIKEFEMKRNAKQYARASVSKTGELDLKKVASYRFKDDIFKRISVVPKGKNHGLLMFIDYSGSMTDNIAATVEQTAVLATFCRKVNIPFRVYAFTDLRNNPEDFAIESGLDKNHPGIRQGIYKDYSNISELQKFSTNEGEIVLDNKHFRLREYLSSEMSSLEFKEAIKYWLLVSVCMSRRSWRGRGERDPYQNIVSTQIRAHDFEGLNGTPLNEAIVAAIDIVKLFKQQYRLDVVNTVFLTDGESNDNYNKYEGGFTRTYGFRNEQFNLVIRDKKTMVEGKKTPKSNVTVALLNLLRNATKTNAIGFFITPYYSRRLIQSIADTYDAKIEDFDTMYRKSKDNKFFMVNDAGYDDYYIIPGGEDLEIKDETLDDIETETKNDIKKAFLKMQKGKSVNRILLTRFIDKIA